MRFSMRVLISLLCACGAGDQKTISDGHTTPTTGPPTTTTTGPTTTTSTCDPSWADADNDGFGDPEVSTTRCDPGSGWVDNSDDCDDTDSVIHPNAYDGCDGIDQNCNEAIDDDYRDGWYLGTLEEGKIWRIDMATGNTTVVVDFGGFVGNNYSSTDLLDDSQVGIAYQYWADVLWKFDVCAGTLWELGPTNITNTGGISYGPSDRLFGFSQGEDAIVEFNDANGGAVILSPLGFDAGSAGMAFDCTTETLYATDVTTDTLYTIDPNNGAVLTATPLSVDMVGPGSGMEWDHLNQQLIVLADFKLYSVDPATGVAVYSSTLSGLNEVNDLAFFPPCP